MTIDPTITWGAILNAAVLFTGFIIAFTKIGGRIDLLTLQLKSVENEMGIRLSSVEEAIKNQRDTSQRLAVIEERQATHGKMIAGAQEDIRDIKHGRGFIRPRAEGGIDGEYS